ncbi:gamma-secretase subunit APH-1A [Crotalus adamanteus]|uniref:Gamma-secretase subunit APH-1 n=1 Tax=Crotalus adamanteus TaxID=8729 RepID=A0AAW1ALJ1_CROAD
MPIIHVFLLIRLSCGRRLPSDSLAPRLFFCQPGIFPKAGPLLPPAPGPGWPPGPALSGGDGRGVAPGAQVGQRWKPPARAPLVAAVPDLHPPHEKVTPACCELRRPRPGACPAPGTSSQDARAGSSAQGPPSPTLAPPSCRGAMGASVFFGCSCIAFGPALALCLLTVAGDPLRVLILVAGAFFWLVSLLLASLVWFISIHLSDQENKRLQHLLLMFGATVSVLLQEAFRFAHFKLLKKADEGLVTISEDGRSPISTKQMAYDSIGPGTVGIHGDSPYYFITSAFLTMALVFLHTFWGVVFFDACETRRYWKLALVVVSHLVISGLTFLNPYYEASLIPIFLITVSTGVWAFFTAGGSLRNILACLSCREKENGHIMVYSELQLPMED